MQSQPRKVLSSGVKAKCSSQGQPRRRNKQWSQATFRAFGKEGAGAVMQQMMTCDLNLSEIMFKLGLEYNTRRLEELSELPCAQSQRGIRMLWA